MVAGVGGGIDGEWRRSFRVIGSLIDVLRFLPPPLHPPPRASTRRKLKLGPPVYRLRRDDNHPSLWLRQNGSPKVD